MLGLWHQRGDVLVTSQCRLSGVNVTIGASHESGDRRRPKQLQLFDLLFLSERRRRHIREGLTLNGHVEFHNICTGSSNILMSLNHVFISEKATNEKPQCDCYRFLALTINTKTRLSEWENTKNRTPQFQPIRSKWRSFWRLQIKFVTIQFSSNKFPSLLQPTFLEPARNIKLLF